MIDSKIKVAVVIINYNGINHLKKFLPSVVKYTDKNISQVYVIDNCSTDDSINFLKNKYPEIIIIKNDQNYGYAKGYNKGLQTINSKYLVLLNNDVEVTENWLNVMLDKMVGDELIGSCQPKILSYTNRDEFEYAGACGGYIDYLGYPYCRGRIFNISEKDNGQYNKEKEIFWSSGACIMINNELFKKVGGFDESFFAHMEEIDLCWRLRAEGYTNYCFPDSTVYHLGGGTLDYESSNKTYLNFRNNLLMITKNEKRISLIIKLPLRLFFDLIASIRFLFIKKSIPNFFSVLRAYLYFIINFPKVFFHHRKKVDNKSLRYSKIIPIDFFLRGKKRFTDL